MSVEADTSHIDHIDHTDHTDHTNRTNNANQNEIKLFSLFVSTLARRLALSSAPLIHAACRREGGPS